MDAKSQKNGSKKDALDSSVFQELGENPYHKFNIAFSLMTIIPFLAFFYILINISSLDALAGQAGGITRRHNGQTATPSTIGHRTEWATGCRSTGDCDCEPGPGDYRL